MSGESESFNEVGADVMSPAAMDAAQWSNEETRALPQENEVVIPFGWRILVMPMRPLPRTAGGIYIPQTIQDTNQYLNYIGRVVALGSLCYRHSKYAQMGMTEADRPKRGDWILYKMYQYDRIDFKGTKLLVLNDDSFIGILPPGVNPWDFKVER